MILSLCATHKRASVPILESLTFQDEQETMSQLCRLPFVQECVLLQTCNRVEIHVVGPGASSKEAVDRLVDFWSGNSEISRDVIFHVLEVFEGREALCHLLFLAAGLESMVVGEDQILGQIRNAYVKAKQIGTVKSLLETVLMKAVNVGRRVRAETGISRGSVSISSVAVDLAQQLLGDMKSVRVLLIGAGEAATLAGEELRKNRVGNVLVANRTYKRGVHLAKKIGGEAVSLEDVNNYISKVDLVIAAASAGTPLLTLETMRSVTKNAGKPLELLVMDISQPRCVEEAVGHLPGVKLKTIDDLRSIVEANLEKRSAEAEKARAIVLEELDHLERLLKKMAAQPTISSLYRKVEEIRAKELSKALGMIGGISQNQRLVVENLTKELVERILQLPVQNLREGALNDDSSLLSAANRLFSLESENRKRSR